MNICKHLPPRILVILVASMCLTPSALVFGNEQAYTYDSPWPMFHHDLHLTGRSPYLGAQTNYLKWTFTTGGPISYSSAAIGADGTIYLGSHDNNLYAINPDGTVKEGWPFMTGDKVESSPAIGSDGTIYVGSKDNKLYAIDPNGTKKWEFPTEGHVDSSPSIGKDGTIYVGSDDRKLYAIDPNGTKKWHFTTSDIIDYHCPSIADDGTIYIASSFNLYTLDPNGTLKPGWPFPLGNYHYFSSATIGDDGTIYIGSRVNKVYAIEPNGTEKPGEWPYLTDGWVDATPAIGNDGTIYVGAEDDKLHAIDPNGAKKSGNWPFQAGGNIDSSAAIGCDGTLYVGSDDCNLYAINPDDCNILWSYPTGGVIKSSPAIGPDGTIYVGSYDGKLYAFGTAWELLVPNGGERWAAGTTHNIDWEIVGDANIPEVKIEYSTNNGQGWNDVNTVPNTGSYEWLVPEVTSLNCLVRIRDVNCANIYDKSDGLFTVFQCQRQIPGDLNADCYIDFSDFAIFAQYWMRCGNPLDPACGFEAFWSFDEGSGEIAHDCSVNGNDGQIYGAAWTIGKVGNALSFDGSDDWVDVPDDISPEHITITAWIYPTGFDDGVGDNGNPIITKETGAGVPPWSESFAWRLRITPREHLLQFYAFTNTGGTEAVSTTVLQTNTWYYVAATYDGEAAKLYVKVILEDTNISSSPGPLVTTSLPTAIGHLEGWSTQWFEGIIDELCIYDTALSETEIRYLYEKP